MLKRSVDILLSVVLLFMASPVLALAALSILLTSPGPVLFRQVRMGRGFRPFEILKLRTMSYAEAGPAFTFGEDPRITPLGKFLRRSKLDELPQLWNVLCGDMSLVGPRPVLPVLTEEFHEHYEVLLSAKPGLTDPASLKYSQEARLMKGMRDPMPFFKQVVTPDKLRLSIEYMSQANLWTDSVTMAMTAVICCFPSMSRMYGELPLPVDAAAPRRPQTQPAFAMAAARVDQAIFSHELAYLEAAVEEGPHLTDLPWILLQEPSLGSQSASYGAGGSVSRL